MKLKMKRKKVHPPPSFKNFKRGFGSEIGKRRWREREGGRDSGRGIESKVLFSFIVEKKNHFTYFSPFIHSFHLRIKTFFLLQIFEEFSSQMARSKFKRST